MTGQPAAEFWRYAVRLYGQNGVEEACLALQARGFNVNLLMLICWLADQGRSPLGRQDLRQVIAAIEPWNLGVTDRLREARRCVKQQGGRHDLYRRLLDLELDAERIEQTQLLDALPDTKKTAGVPDQAAGESLAAYLALFPEPQMPCLRRHVNVLLAAAFPRYDEQADRRRCSHSDYT